MKLSQALIMDDNLPPPIKMTPNLPNIPNSPNNDDPIFEAKINNPFSKFFEWIKSFIKRNQNITIKIPIIGIFVALSSFSLGVGSGYNWGFNTAFSKLFPNSSPVFHRAISVEGVMLKSALNKYYLKTESNLWILKSKPPITSTTLSSLANQQVKILGNLTKEVNVIEVSEVIPQGTSLESSISLTTPNIPNSSALPNPSNSLPDPYPNLSWTTNQKKLLIFTSGKRKIEQEGIYLESAQMIAFPQEFINYYLEKLKAQGFKETLNSISPEGIAITYAKDDLFLTFGVKNIYQGKADSKKLVGYIAYLEHN
ncbi:hypothetical protein A3C26_02985 [Candidatus Daviesbacteria bacterium RIFCSPHIGHO2_02_FULL_39_12]|uniref:Uncharacterized protein n=2 Tax=Candidatus Daviesiibacteriota TaxID=1752718 RepID=A0A1F5JE39_9BACT|nr:MAG: hypothetical protein A3C26_02985 [Candidatus Daviesbacteria bacterium RIFCSPHIGHO2_02_FULL_39_12]OGE71450.1 MAG: hypothetical protein A3H40_02895 [Candidatus Daviesbacteria bacterium RIFCSPLOWO2_02_FULL_38_15]